MSLIGVVSISLTASLFFLLQKNMAWIVTRFQGLLPCDVYTACKDFVPEFLVISVILTYFIYSFFFLRPFFIRRFRAWTDAEFVLYSHPDDCSNGPLVHSLRSVRFRIRTFLLNLIFRVSHFRNCQRRKQGAKHRHCSAQKISNLGFFIPTNNQCDKAGGRPEHKFIDRSKLHFFLRVLGLDFCLTAQILPSTPETNFVRMR